MTDNSTARANKRNNFLSWAHRAVPAEHRDGFRYAMNDGAHLEQLAELARPFAEIGSDLTNAPCHKGLVSVERCGRCGPVLHLRAFLEILK